MLGTKTLSEILQEREHIALKMQVINFFFFNY